MKIKVWTVLTEEEAATVEGGQYPGDRGNTKEGVKAAIKRNQEIIDKENEKYINATNANNTDYISPSTTKSGDIKFSITAVVKKLLGVEAGSEIGGSISSTGAKTIQHGDEKARQEAEAAKKARDEADANIERLKAIHSRM